MAKRAFSIVARLVGKDESAPILKGLGKIRVAGKATGGLLKGAMGLGAKALALGGISGAGAILTVGGLVKTFKDLADSQSTAIQQSDRLATRLGFTLPEMQRWEYVAQRADVGVESFHGSMRTFALSMGQVEVKAGRAYKALLRFGGPSLEAGLRKAHSPAEKFQLLLKALGDTRVDKGIRENLAKGLFGDEGVGIVRIAELGRDRIDELRRAADKWGLSSADAAKKQEAYEEATKDLDAAMTGLKRTVGESVMPIFTTYATKLAGWVQGHRDLIGVKVGAFFEGLGKFAEEWLPRAAKAADEALPSFEALGTALKVVVAPLKFLNDVGIGMAQTYEMFGGDIGGRRELEEDRYRREVAARERMLSDYSPEELAAAQSGAQAGKRKAAPGKAGYWLEVELAAKRNRRDATRPGGFVPPQGGVASEPTPSPTPGRRGQKASVLGAPVRVEGGKAEVKVVVSDDRVRVKSVRTEGNLDVRANAGDRADLDHDAEDDL